MAEKPSIGKRARQRLRGRRLTEVAGNGYAFTDGDGIARSATFAGAKVSLDIAESQFDYAGTPSFKKMTTAGGFSSVSRFDADGLLLQRNLGYDWEYDGSAYQLVNALQTAGEDLRGWERSNWKKTNDLVVKGKGLRIFCAKDDPGSVSAIIYDGTAFVFSAAERPSFTDPSRHINPAKVSIAAKGEMTEADVAHATKVILPEALRMLARASAEILEVSIGIERSGILNKPEVKLKERSASASAASIAEAEQLFASDEKSLAEIVESEVSAFYLERGTDRPSEAERALFLQKLTERITADPKQLVLLLSRDESLRTVSAADLPATVGPRQTLFAAIRQVAGPFTADDLDSKHVSWAEVIDYDADAVLGAYGISERGQDAVVPLLAAIVPNRVRHLAGNALNRQASYEIAGVNFGRPALVDDPADLTLADAWRVVSGESGIDR